MFEPKTFGVSFSPAGLLSPFHFGVSSRLRTLSYITDTTILAGASGGALAAVTTALDIEMNALVKGCGFISKKCKAMGTRLTLRLSLDEVMEDILPPNAADLIRDRTGPLFVAYTEIFPQLSSRYVSDFTNKDDMMQVLRASCNIPFYFNGNAPFVMVRQTAAIDGFFASPRSRFGSPTTNADAEVIICPFDTSIVGLQHSNVISPALLSNKLWQLTTSELLTLALAPPTSSIYNKLQSLFPDITRKYDCSSEIDFVYNFLYDRGVLAADEWARQQIHDEKKVCVS